MANISAAQVKDLREKTGAPMMDCKTALTEAKGDMEQAVVILRKKGVSVAAKKATRVTSEGAVTSYIHAGGKIGVLLEVNCESDFVAAPTTSRNWSTTSPCTLRPAIPNTSARKTSRRRILRVRRIFFSPRP